MASPISELGQITGDMFGQGTAGQLDVAKSHQSKNQHQETKVMHEGDTVTLSLSARVKEMKEEGQSTTEIANRLNVDIKTVERYLAITPASAETLAHQMKLQGDSLSQIADQLAVDIKTVKSYLGIVPLPPAAQAKQLEQQGESVIEIANRLGVDLKTVKGYLGIGQAASEATVEA